MSITVQSGPWTEGRIWGKLWTREPSTDRGARTISLPKSALIFSSQPHSPTQPISTWILTTADTHSQFVPERWSDDIPNSRRTMCRAYLPSAWERCTLVLVTPVDCTDTRILNCRLTRTLVICVYVYPFIVVEKKKVYVARAQTYLRSSVCDSLLNLSIRQWNQWNRWRSVHNASVKGNQALSTSGI